LALVGSVYVLIVIITRLINEVFPVIVGNVLSAVPPPRKRMNYACIVEHQ